MEESNSNKTSIEKSRKSFDLTDYCKKYYRQAVVTLVWVIKENDENKRRQLLFCSIELVPRYLGDQFECAEQKKSIEPYRIFFRRHITTVEEALKQYNSAAEYGTIPVPGQDDLIHIVPEEFETATPIAIPESGETVFNKKLPFLIGAFRFEGAQTSHLMFSKRSKELESFVSKKKVVKWLKERLLWNLDENLEYVGSLNLVLPNPFFSHSEMRLVPGSADSLAESVRLSENHDCSGKGLTVLFVERSNGEYGTVRQFKLECSEIIIPLQGLADQVAYSIIDEYGRILAQNGFCNFFRSMISSVNVLTGGIEKKCLDGTKQLIYRKQYNPTTYSDPSLDTDIYRLRWKISSIRHERKMEANAKDQHLFHKNQADAERFIRCDIINNASKKVLIVDPYFSLRTVESFIDNVVNYGVSISVICTSRGWAQIKEKKIVDDVEQETTVTKEQRYSELKSKIDELRNKGYAIAIYVVGDNQLHDRFICVDDNEAWMLGASLDKPTGSLTAILKLDNAPGVIRYLNNFIDKADKRDFDHCMEIGNGDT